MKSENDTEGFLEFSKKIKDVMEEMGVKEDRIEEFESWRPCEGDSKKDLKKRTAEITSMRDTKVEKESKGLSGDMKEAKENMKEAIGEAKQRKCVKESEKSFVKSITDFFRPFLAYFFKFARKTEETIYSDVMLRFNSCYFDADKISIRLDRKGDEFVTHVNSPIKKYRKILRNGLMDGDSR